MISKIRASMGIIISSIIIGIGLYFITINYRSTAHTQTYQTNNEDKPNRWKSFDIGVPVGKVTDSGYLEGLPSSNWLSIETPDGISIVIKNLDWQTHSAIKVGDIIE